MDEKAASLRKEAEERSEGTEENLQSRDSQAVPDNLSLCKKPHQNIMA